MITNEDHERTVNIQDIVTDNHVRQTISLLYEGIDELEDTIDKLLRQNDESANLRTIIAQLNRRIAHITTTRDVHIKELQDKLVDKDKRIKELDAECNEMSRNMSNRCVCMDGGLFQLARKDKHIKRLESKLIDRDDYINELEASIAAYRSQNIDQYNVLNSIHNSILEWTKYGATELQIRVVAKIIGGWRPVGKYDHVPDTGIVMVHPRIKELESTNRTLTKVIAEKTGVINWKARQIADLMKERKHLEDAIDELEDTNVTLANDVERVHGKCDFLKGTSTNLEQCLGQRCGEIRELKNELERWQSTTEVLADKDLMAQIEESKKAWARPFDDAILDMDRFTLAGSIAVPMPDDPRKIVGDNPECYRLVQRIEERDRYIDQLERKNIDLYNVMKEHKSDLANTTMQLDVQSNEIDVLRTHNEMLAGILKIVNPLIRSNEYKYPSNRVKLADAMNRVCCDVVAFRKSHSIVGASA